MPVAENSADVCHPVRGAVCSVAKYRSANTGPGASLPGSRVCDAPLREGLRCTAHGMTICALSGA